jgi:hypothetical protein
MYNVADEPLVISKSLIDMFLKEPNTGDLIALYTFYYYTAKWQKTNTARATTNYTAEGLDWSADRVRRAKKVLLQMGLIQDVQTKNEQGQITGNFVFVRFVWSDNSIKKIQETTLPENRRVEKLEANALSVYKGNALSTVSEPEKASTINRRTRTKPLPPEPPIPFIDKFPTTYQQNPTFVKTWDTFYKQRKVSKAPLTDDAVKRIVTKLKDNCGDDIEHVIQCLDSSIECGYRGVFIDRKRTVINKDFKQPSLPYQEEPKKTRFITPHPHDRNENIDYSYLEDSYPHRLNK